MKDKIKICFVIDHLNIGGAGKLTIDVINGLNKDDFEISLLYLNPIDNNRNLKSFISGHVKTIFVDISKFSFIKRILILKNIFRKYDIINSALELSNFYCSLVKFFIPTKVQFIATIHGIGGVFIEDKLLQNEIRKNWSKKYVFTIKYLQNYLFKFHDKFITVCNYTKNFLIDKRRINEKKISVVYHGINVQSFSNPIKIPEIQKIKDKLCISRQDFTLGYVGRLSYGKGLEHLLETFSEFCLINNNLKLLLVGDGILKEKLHSFIISKNLTHNCIITGMVISTKEYYNIMDLFVLPSLSEAIPLTALEAMFQKRIVLTSNAGGLPEIINDGENGFMFNSGNFHDMKDKILFIYNNKDKFEKIKENAYNTVINKFNLNNNILKIESIYRELYNH